MAGMRERGEESVLGRKAGRPGRVNSYRPDRLPANRPWINTTYIREKNRSDQICILCKRVRIQDFEMIAYSNPELDYLKYYEKKYRTFFILFQVFFIKVNNSKTALQKVRVLNMNGR